MIGTLKEIDAQVGDKVKVVRDGKGDPIDGKVWTICRIAEDGHHYGKDATYRPDHPGTPLAMSYGFTIVSRAVETWTIFNNVTPFEKLEAFQKAALQAWDGPFVSYRSIANDWKEVVPRWNTGGTYRAVPKPEEKPVADQVTSAALTQLHDLLGAKTHTEAVQLLENLMEMEASLTKLLDSDGRGRGVTRLNRLMELDKVLRRHV